VAVVAHADGSIQRVAQPAPWAATLTQRRRVARQASRRIVGSRGQRQARTKLAALDRRAANLRRESMHTITTALARRYGTVVVEDLDVAAMALGMGRRAFRRSVSQAGIGGVRPILAYKTAWAGGQLVVADRWLRPPRPITAAVATSQTSSCASERGRVRSAGDRWTATPTQP
jgi:putative transposase